MKKYNMKLIMPKGLGGVSISPPLGLLTIASLTPDDFNVTISDENTERVQFSKCDIVGISVHTATADRSYEISRMYREMGVKVILGGIHVSALPEEAMENADAVVVGEAETVWSKVLDDFKKDRLLPIYKAEKSDLKNLPLVDWNLVKGKKYIYNYLLQTSRGCPYGCEFCSVSPFYGRKLRSKSIPDVINEIKNILRHHNSSKKPFIHIVDDNIGINANYSKELFKAMVPLNVSWRGEMSVNNALDTELLDLAAASGCSWLRLGLESVSQRTLDQMKKPFKLKQYRNAITNIKKRGIIVQGSFVFGYDSDDEQVFQNTLDFCCREMIDFIMVHPLCALPGTVLYKKAVEEGKVIKDRYKLQPRNMTSFDMLEKLVLETAVKFYSPHLIFRRIMKNNKSVRRYSFARYLASNLALRMAYRKRLSELGNA
jgi:radical SAM superfamily enzyme YgiQ (UPF0313 family)